MKGYFKLIDLVTVPETIHIARKHQGMVQNRRMKLQPGVKYQLEDDELFIKCLERASITKRKTPELVKTLERNNIPYKEKMCKACAGNVAKLEYQIIEVVIVKDE